MFSLRNTLLSLICISAATAHHGYVSPRYVPFNADCYDYAIPVAITSKNFQWIGPRWTDDYEWIDFLTTTSSRPSAGFPLPFGNPINQTASYNISATFCTPKKVGPKAKTVLLATHGLGFDRSYWNFPADPEKYNFVQYAAEQGYSAFFYDRLGVGQSSKVSGYQIQLSIETAVLTSLSKSLRQGRYTAPAIGAPTSLILIGHSFGSATSNAALVQIPSLVDAAILTGFGLNGSTSASVFLGVQPRIARLQRPHAFAAFDAAYLTTVDVFSTITTFFKAPDYDRAIARRAEATKQPFSLFEFLTFGGTVAPEYGGPVLVISGEFDFPICGGLCTGVLDDGLRAILPNAKVLESYVQPGAGHATNLALNATDFYAKIFSFLKRQGL